MSRPFADYTPLGRKMRDAGLSVKEVEYATEISYRTLSDYLAWRKAISDRHMVRLCALFECEPEELEPWCWVCGDEGCWDCEVADDY